MFILYKFIGVFLCYFVIFFEKFQKIYVISLTNAFICDIIYDRKLDVTFYGGNILWKSQSLQTTPKKN